MCLGTFSACGGSLVRHTSYPPQCDPARRAFCVIGNSSKFSITQKRPRPQRHDPTYILYRAALRSRVFAQYHKDRPDLEPQLITVAFLCGNFTRLPIWQFSLRNTAHSVFHCSSHDRLLCNQGMLDHHIKSLRYSLRLL